MFSDLFNENEMATIEWVVMQILGCSYEDIHGKVIVKNIKLPTNHPKERRKYVDLLVSYKNEEINIELNNNFNGNYIRNYLYAFTLIFNKYLRKPAADYYSNLYKVISVNLNWYQSKQLSKKVPSKRIITLPCSDKNNEYLLKIIMVNLDNYNKICYNKVTGDEKFYKLLTIDNKEELDKIIAKEKLLEDYGSKIVELSNNTEEEMEWKDEYDDILSKFENYQDAKYDGIELGSEQKEREMIINMYDNNISLEMIAKIAKVSLARVKKILNEETVTVK